ncbi:FtsX-like permease family protein [Dokdonella sp.]|uniref:ABC transporter permease n=1 Tax=Dokdonella sp. TaxID=2291710 RepID=UPI001B1ECF1D|nr:FtsX-like permease family protein [Dokdonella sp.]MBO9663859.1 FtsX-like permease family protein [Dokdonella sp.]
MRPLAFAARSLRREFRQAELATLAAALVLAVAALAAVATLASRVERAILASAAELIGGDLGLNAGKPLPPEFAAEAQRRGLATNRLADFPSVVFAGETSKLADVRASDDAFPLRSELRVLDAKGTEKTAHAPPPGAIYADRSALAALDVDVGAQVQLGGRDLLVAGEIAQSPDGGNVFRLAPRVLMNLADAQASGLIGVGSRARHRLLLAGDAAAIADFAAWAKPRLPDGAELTTVEDAQQNLRTAFERGESFLRLAALLAALLSGVAVALAAQRFARRKTEEVALLRCLGASRGEILVALLLELGLLALPACLLGLAVGLGLQELVLSLARGLLPGTAPGLPWGPPLAAFAVGLAVLFGFALPPLLRLREIEPMRVFRRESARRLRRFDALYLLPLAVGAVLIFFGAGNPRLAATLAAGFAGVALATLALGSLLLGLVRTAASRLRGALRFGLANLSRRRRLTLLQAGALSLSLTALAVLAVVGPSLLARWRADLPADTPNWFVLNLQTDQRATVEQRLRELGATNLNTLPLAVGKLVAINGRAPDPNDYEDRRAAGWINGETRVSWSDALPEANALLQGRWFDATPTAPQISVDEMWVRMFHLKLGDTMTLRVGEREITATIASIRGVDWDSFRVNFFLMLDPASGAGLPHSHVASFHLAGDATRALAGLSRDHPNLSLIDLNAILDRVRDIIARVSRAVAWVLGFSLAAGLLVLLAALASTADERRHETALLRTLGAHARQLDVAVLAEFAVLGLLAGSIAIVGAGAIGTLLARQVFRLNDYLPPIGELSLVVIGAALAVALAGWIGTLRIARTSPMNVLRRA